MRSTTVRTALRALCISVAIALLTLLSIFFLLQRASRVRDLVAHGALRSDAIRIVADVRAALQPTADTYHIVEHWLKMKSPSVTDQSLLSAYMVPLMLRMPEQSGFVIVDARGNEFFVTRDHATLVTRMVQAAVGDAQAQFQSYRLDGTLETVWNEKISYNPRTRPWYESAVAANEGEVVWTEPYEFFTWKARGVTASSVVNVGFAEAYYVLAMDISLPSLEKIISQSVAETPLSVALVSPADELVTAGVFPESIAGRVQGMASGDSVTCLHNGEEWIFRKKVYGDAFPNLSVVVGAPASYLMEPYDAKRKPLVVVIAVLLFLAMTVIGVVLFLGLRGERGRVRVHSLEHLRTLIADGEGDTVEFKSTVRWNLKANKPGKEIELAWLKNVVAFLNTNGGIVLIGVQDDGTLGGIQADNFQNDDKCLLHVNNLIKQHIGLESMSLISYRLVPVAGQQVLVIECQPSKKPVFLKYEKEEEFYVRSGPAARKLPMSTVIEYMKQRKG